MENPWGIIYKRKINPHPFVIEGADFLIYCGLIIFLGRIRIVMVLFLGKKLVNVGVCPDDSRDYHRRKDGTSKKVHGSGRVHNGENQSSDVKSY